MVGARDRARPEELAGRPDSGHKGPGKIRAQGKLGEGEDDLERGRLVLTPYLRRKLKKPVGRLFSPSELTQKRFLALLRSAPLVVTVGDRVTETMQELGRTPDVQVIDEVERRTRRQAPDVPYRTLKTAFNPAGTITDEAVRAIAQAMRDEKPARVLIQGEEDLLAIPAILEAPSGSVVYYGQPGVGVVAVVADERARSSAERTMRSMKKMPC